MTSTAILPVPDEPASGLPFDLEPEIARRGLPEPEAARLRRALNFAPDRILRPGAFNMTDLFPSDKTGQTNPGESVNELAYQLVLDANERVEFWVSQPAIRLRLTFHDQRGRRVSIWSTPDFLVVERDGDLRTFVFVEVKPEEVLAGWARETPERARFEDGRYRSLAGETAAERMGAEYRLVSSNDFPPHLAGNLLLVRDYHGRSSSLDPATVESIRAAVAANPNILLRHLAREHRADDILALLADGLLYGDLEHEAFHAEGNGHLFLDRDAAAAYPRQVVPVPLAEAAGAILAEEGRRVVFEAQGWRIVAVAQGRVVLQSESSERVVPLPRAEFNRLAAAGSLTAADPPTDDWVRQERERRQGWGPKAWTAAGRRQAILDAAEAGQPVRVSRRTLSRWRAGFTWAETYLGWGYLGLLAPPHGGNRSNHGEPERAALVDATAAEIYESGEATTIMQVFGALIDACAKKGFEPPSYETVRQAVHRARVAVQVGVREGRKAGNAARGPVAGTSPLAPHGTRGWMQAHIDHTLLDLELVDDETGINLGRVWLTLLIDSYSRAVLGYSLSFGAPSRASVFAALRDCVRRHRRLPEMIVLDGGAEFASEAFETLAAAFRITLRWRAASNPRFGAEIESFFGGFTKSFLHALRGGTKATKNVRLLTKETDPAVRAVWDLLSFARFFEAWIDTVYHQRPHPAHHLPPVEALARSQAWSGERVMRVVADSEAFYIATLPEVEGKTRIIDHRRGIKVGNIQYHHPSFEWGAVSQAGKRHKRGVLVRRDPHRLQYAYAFVQGTWVRAEAPVFRLLGDVSEAELAAASVEFARLQTLTGQARPATALALATLLAEARKHETVLLARRQAAAERAVVAAGTDLRVLPGRRSRADTPSDPIPAQAAAEPADDLPGLFEEAG
jgi:putative transposase